MLYCGHACVIGEIQFVKSIIPKKRKADEQALDALSQPASRSREIATSGPRASIAASRFDRMSKHEKVIWAQNARIQSVLGACARTLPSVRSGLRCYLAFASKQRDYMECVFSVSCCQCTMGKNHFYPQT